MKKAISFVLSFLMIFSLAACGAPDSPTSPPSEGVSSEGLPKEEDKTVQEDVYEVVMQWPTMGDTPSGLYDVEAAINAIVEPEIGVRVRLEPVNVMALTNETTLAVSSGEQLDLALSLATGVSSKVNSGILLELDDLVEQYGQDILEHCGEVISGGYYGGALYGVPVAYVRGAIFGYIARRDILEKYGFSPSEYEVYDLDYLEEVFEAVKAGEGDNFFMYTSSGGNGEMTSFATAYPYDTVGATSASGALPLWKSMTDTEIVNIYATDTYREYAERMYDWAQKRYVSSDALTDTETGQAKVAAGNYLGWFVGDVGVPGASAIVDYAAQTGHEMAVVPLTEGYGSSSRYQGVLWSVTITSARPEKAMQFLNYIYKDSRISNLFQYGIEGESYVVIEEDDEGGKVITLPEGKTSDTVPYSQMFGVYGDRFDWHVMAPNTLEHYKTVRAWSDALDNFSPGLGYCFVTDSVSAEYSAVQAVVNQYAPVIAAGAADPAEQLSLFLAELEAAGIDKVIAENQRQFDEWLAAK